jgi:3-hydroxy-5-methyl-1-naphthoate 3-O-methyltransferase
MNANSSPTPDRLMQLAWSFAPALIIEAAVQQGVFERLNQGPRSAAELATETGASVRGVTAILNVLVGLELLGRDGNRYVLTAESAAFLVPSRAGYHGMFFEHISDQLLPRWLQLNEIVRTGRPTSHVNQEEEGAQFFAALVEALFPISFSAATALGEHLGISATAAPMSVLDIGAGSGVWGIALAQQSPLVRIHAVDWPRVLDVTKKVVAQHGLSDRLTAAPGEFFEADFGSGHQIATLGHILHSEGRDRSLRLLKKVWSALAPGGTIAIQEFVPNEERTGPLHTLIFAVNMLVNTDEGDTFTFAEMSAWLKKAGYVNPRLLDVPSVSPLILADKPRS